MSLFSDKPRVSLRLGKSLDPDNLRTGNDVYFECDVKANPIPHKLVWLHRVRLIYFLENNKLTNKDMMTLFLVLYFLRPTLEI